MTDAKRFSKIMRDMAKVPSRAAKKTAQDISSKIQRNFDQGVDPYGRHWRELAESTVERGRHEPPLTDSGRGRSSVTVAAMAGAGWRITVGVLYMIYHQFGGASHLRGPGGSYRKRKQNKHFGRDKDRGGRRKKPPKRSFLPFDRMPSAWGEIVRSNIEAAAKKVLRG